MKKLAIFSIIIMALTAGTVATIIYINSFQKVSVTLGEDVTEATLYKVNPEEGHDHEIKGDPQQKITKSGELSLQNGAYYIIPEGEKISKEEITFTVDNGPLSVDVRPSYSDEYLISLLNSEQAAITQVITDKFPSNMANYVIKEGALYKKGEWYGALLMSNASNPDLRSQSDYYRIILHKENGVWSVVQTPQLVLSAAEFKDVPADILRAVNKLTPPAGL